MEIYIIYALYGFLIGLYAGRLTNLFSNFVLTGIVLYFCKPHFYTYENIFFMKNLTLSTFRALIE